jgi:monofunctional biosynthetic peptidoglycan transglycosylase
MIRRAVRLVLLAIATAQVAFLLHITIESLMLRNRIPQWYSLLAIREWSTGSRAAPQVPVSLEEVPISLLYTLVVIEDHEFANHAGFQMDSIRRAVRINRAFGYRAYGGSTLTQQLARTLFLYPRKSYLRKILEIEAAVVLDIVLSKERILELYVNCVEWGPSLFGLGAAAQRYYNEPVSALAASQIVDLVTILASPVLYDPESYMESQMLRRRHAAVYAIHTFVDGLPSRKRVEIRPQL